MKKLTCESCQSARPCHFNSTLVCANKDFNNYSKEIDPKSYIHQKLMRVQYEMASDCAFFKKRQNKLKVKHSPNWKGQS